MVTTGAVASTEALSSIDYSTILLLFGLMIISAQFTVSGFYNAVSSFLEKQLGNPKRFLFVLMISCGTVSAFLTNDVMCLAITPLIIPPIIRLKINPVPFVIAIAVSSNIGSAATIIGNPQNMLIAQSGSLSFYQHFLWSIIPVFFSMVLSWIIIQHIYRNSFVIKQKQTNGRANIHLRKETSLYNPHQTIKGMTVLLITLALFLSPLSRETTVMCTAAFLLISRTTRTMELLSRVDWQLLVLFCSLFIVIAGITKTGIPAEIIESMNRFGINIHNGYILGGISTLLSTAVSNVPATMLIVPHLPVGNKNVWYLLALTITFAGNLIIIGSIANIIAIEIAYANGVKISFMEHARIGIPVTLTSLLIAFGWYAITT